MSNNNIRILSEPVACPEIKKMPNVIISGIYKIENTVNHKVYIGQSKNIISRFKRGHLLLHTVCNSYLKAAFEKYGYENFTVEVIKETYDLDYWEIFLIQIYKATDKRYGYNMCEGGYIGDSFKGHHHSEETKKLMSLHSGTRGMKYTPEQRYAMGSRWRGKHRTEEEKKRISEKLKGCNKYPKTEEHRRKIAQTLKGNIPGNKGMKMDKEFCDKQKELKKKLYSSEKGEITKQKLRKVNEGLYYWNNGEIEIHSKEAPEGFSRGRLESVYKRKYWYTNEKVDVYVSACPKGYKYGRTFPDDKGKFWNNGEITLFAVNCPGEGFVKGQLHNPK